MHPTRIWKIYYKLQISCSAGIFRQERSIGSAPVDQTSGILLTHTHLHHPADQDRMGCPVNAFFKSAIKGNSGIVKQWRAGLSLQPLPKLKAGLAPVATPPGKPIGDLLMGSGQRIHRKMPKAGKKRPGGRIPVDANDDQWRVDGK